MPTIDQDRLLRELGQRFGIGIRLRSVDGEGPVVVRATVFNTRRTDEIEGQGATEAEAWEDLVQAIAAWHASEPDPAAPWRMGGG